MSGLHHALWVGAGLAALGALATAVLIRKPRTAAAPAQAAPAAA